MSEPITITIEMASFCDLTVAEIWPDGDQPDEITDEAVIEVMKKCGRHQVINDWGLLSDDNLEVYVTVGDGHSRRVYL